MLVHAGNWTQVTWVKFKSADHYTIWTLLFNKVDFNKVSYRIKALISLPQIKTIDIGHKSLPFNGSFYSESSIRFSNLQTKYSKLLSWAWNLNKLFTVFGGKFQF